MTSTLRVATVPAQHAYLDAALPPSVHRVQVAAVPGRAWAPSVLFTEATLRAMAPRIDVLHLHFGFDHLSTADLRRWAGVLAEVGIPLVLTVHDLRNPHHDDPARHLAHLSVLIPAAAEVITLTDGAAREIAERWNRRATVLAHPAVLATPLVDRTVPGLVGVHLKSLRRNVVDPDSVVRVVAAGVCSAGGTLVVDVHPDAAEHPAISGVRELAHAGALQLRVHARFTDAELSAYLQSLHVSVLPNRFGTHSGWLEACHDVGTAVIAPHCGFYEQQWSRVITYRHDETAGLSPDSLAKAVHRAVLAPAPAPADPAQRARQRAAVQRAHERIYAHVTARAAR